MLNFTFPHDLSSSMLGNLSLLRAMVAKKLILQKQNSPAVPAVIDWAAEMSDLSGPATISFKFKGNCQTQYFSPRLYFY